MIIYDDLFIFITVYENKSYSLAAKVLGISQPSIRRRIQNLERRFGKPLTYSSTNSIVISEFGNRVYDYFKNKHHEINTLLNLLTKENQSIEGELRVTLPIQLGSRLISPYLPEFIQKFPNLKLKLNYKLNEPDLFDSGFDIAVSATLPTQQSLIIRALFNVHVGFFCTRKYAESRSLPQSIHELELNKVVSYLRLDNASENYSILWRHIPTGQEDAIKTRPNLSINNELNGLALLYTDQYIVALQDFEYLWRLSDLVEVLPEYEFYDLEQKKNLSHLSYYLILPSKHKEPKIKAFCEFLTECVSRYEQQKHQLKQGLSQEKLPNPADMLIPI